MVVGHLKLLSGEEREDKVYAFDEQKEYKIGRSRDANVQLKDIKVSRLHSRVTVKGEKYTITDMDSKNGTYVNGERIQTTQLSDGDQIRLGFSVLQFFLARKGSHILESPIERKRCALCAGVISQGDIISGRAEEVNGKHYCPDCLRKFEGVCESERPELSPPSDRGAGRNGKKRLEEDSEVGQEKDEEDQIDLADLIEDED